MIRHALMTAAAAALLAGPATALDLENMTAAEEQAFGEAVRGYLLENPEILIEIIDLLEARQAAEAEGADQNMIAANAEEIFNDGHSYVGGNPDGDVVMVEFIDYRCSFCRRAHPEVHELVNTDGNIRKIIKEFPILGPESVEASRFAISTLRVEGPEAYARVNDALIERRGDFSRRGLERLARDMDLDARRIIAEMDSPEVTEVIDENRALAQRLQISGTPTFVVGDQFIRGYVPLDGMRQVVSQVRAD